MQRKAHLNIRLMGTPQVFSGEMSLALNHLKSRALLFYLAATGQSYTRDHLATLLWGESSQSEASHSLRSSLYHLRKALQTLGSEDALVSNGELLTLDPAFYECDLIEFYRLLAQGNEQALTRAVTLNKGSLLQGFSVTAAPVFEDWIQAESTRFNQTSIDALERLTTWAESREAWLDAIHYAQQLLQIDPFAEAAQQRLMSLYLRQGEVGFALRQYHQFEQRLRQQLGIEPSPETKALYEEILRQQSSRITPAASIASSTTQSNLLPFLWRDDLLHQLSVIGDEAKTGHGSTVLIYVE